MIKRSKNQKKVNSKLIEYNEKYIPKYDVILNTSPPRTGKTINTILYHIEKKIPIVVFVDNENQANDIINDINDINKKNPFLLYWKSKQESCHVFLNKKDMIKEKGKQFFEVFEFKYNNIINICKDCEYTENCNWNTQNNLAGAPDILIMNKKNIATPLIGSKSKKWLLDKFFHYDNDKLLDIDIGWDSIEGTPRTIIFDEKLEELHKIKFKNFNKKEIKLLNKIIKLKNSSADIIIIDENDFINETEIIKDIFPKRFEYNFFKDLNLNYSSLGDYAEKIHLEIFFNKIRDNIQIYDYLISKKAPLPKIGEDYDFELFVYEKLYIDILFEKMPKHKIILLDATPLKTIVDKIKSKKNFKHIDLNSDIFDKNSSLLRIYREASPSMASKKSLIKRIKKKGFKNNILQEKAYNLIYKTKKHIEDHKKLKNINFGIITYKTIKVNYNSEKVMFKPSEEIKEKLKVNTLHFGNSRGRSELNKCEILYILGTDRHPSKSMYNLYRYLGGKKTWKEVDNSRIRGKVEKLEYKNKLFNEIINHQIDSEMEQVIFRNMPHMNKRLTVLEGHLPEKLKKYFKEVTTINMKPAAEKLIFPIVIEEFLKAHHYKKEFNFEDVNKIAKLSFKSDEDEILSALNKIIKEESEGEVIKLIDEYRTKPEDYTFEEIHNIIKEKDFNLINKAKMGSFSSFKRKYNAK